MYRGTEYSVHDFWRTAVEKPRVGRGYSIFIVIVIVIATAIRGHPLDRIDDINGTVQAGVSVLLAALHKASGSPLLRL